MTPCPSCRRHLRAADATCPFCGNHRTLARVVNAVGGVVTAMVLAACYGSPPFKDDTGGNEVPEDSDSDGFDATTDCDDTNAAIHPGATEVCDDTVDNDCDDKADAEDTDCAAK